jgi:cell filamentation protein
MEQNNYEYEWDSSYCYPNSSILRNKLNIHDSEKLSEAERKLTALRIYTLQSKPIKGIFNLRYLQSIHKFIFQDIYPWAGKLRTVNIAKGNQFCNCMYIESGSLPLFNELSNEHYLIGTSTEKIPERLAYYLGEINVIHPFREGNGRTQRVFIQYLAQTAGYHVDFSNVSGQEMIEASAQAFNCDYRQMTEMFQTITTSISTQKQKWFIRQISAKGSPVLKAFQQREAKLNEDQAEEEDQHLIF